MSIVIKSRQHPLCKLVRSLGNHRWRSDRGLFVVPGANGVQAALDARWPLEQLIVPDNPHSGHWRQLALIADVPVTFVDEKILAYLSDVPTAPEVLAVARIPKIEEGLPPASGMTLVLDGIGDPGNVGAIIRSADAAGASRIIITENTADPYGPKAVRASAGSLFHLPPAINEHRSATSLAQCLQREGTPIVIADAHAGQSCFSYPWPQTCALVLGHETRGASPQWQDVAAARITIPNYGRAESLNVAAAGAVALYAWRTRQ